MPLDQIQTKLIGELNQQDLHLNDLKQLLLLFSSTMFVNVTLAIKLLHCTLKVYLIVSSYYQAHILQ